MLTSGWRPESARLAGKLVLVVALLSSSALPGGPALARQDVVSGYGREFHFAGYTWQAKVSNVPVGPGPNFFSDALDTIWTDDAGRLHLRAAQADTGRWQAAEVVLLPSLGYGKYCFQLEALDRPLDPNVVLGLFTWSDRPDDNHRELDIEVSYWGLPNGIDGRYSVQPYQLPAHVYTFDATTADAPSTHCLDWTEGQVVFETVHGSGKTSSTESSVANHTFTDRIPHALDEQVRINLWLLDGQAPSDGEAAEVVVADFTFTPDAAPPDGTGA